MNREIDFDQFNMTEEDLEKKLMAFETVRQTAWDLRGKYNLGYTKTPVEDILQIDYLMNHKIPLCFREIDDDLDVLSNNDNVLDVLE